MSLLHTPTDSLGKPLPDFSLPGTDGETYSPQSFQDASILVIVFTCNHCPYAQHAKPKLHALYEQFKGRGIQFVAINPNDADNYPEDSFEKMKEPDNDYPFPYLYDETQETAHAFGAVCTPDIFVYGPERTLVYRGQIDGDRPGVAAVAAKILAHKETKQKPSEQNDLAEALEALLNNRPVPEQQTPSAGCSIKWKK